MSDYGQCCRAISKHTFAVNIFCTAQSTSQKLHPHELPDSWEPLQSRHLRHLRIQPSVSSDICAVINWIWGYFYSLPGTIWKTFPCICRDYSSSSLPRNLSALADKRVLVQFLYFYWVWSLLCTEISLLHGFAMCFFPAMCASSQDPSPQLQLHSALWEQWQVPPLPTVQAWGELWFKVPNCFNSM